MLYLVRHAPTVFNEAGTLTGQLDIPLSERGRQWAARVGRALAEVSFDYVFTSRLVRAIQTTLAILEENRHAGTPVLVGEFRSAPPPQKAARTVRVLADMDERCFGALEGLPRADHVHIIEDPAASIAGGESMDAFIDRVTRCFVSQVRPVLSEETSTLLVGHGMGIRLLKGLMEGTDPDLSLKANLAHGAVFRCRPTALSTLVESLPL